MRTSPAGTCCWGLSIAQPQIKPNDMVALKMTMVTSMMVVLTLAQMPQWWVVMISAVRLYPPGRNYLLWKGCLCPTIKATYVPELFCLIFLQKLKCQQKHANSFCTEMSVCQSGTLCAPVNSNSQNQKITPDPTLVGRSQLKMYFPFTSQ